MKGLSLPINMIIIIAIAVLVLVVIAAFFTAQTGSGIGNIALEEAFNRGCTTWRSVYNCGTTDFVVSGYTLPGSTGSALFSQVCSAKTGGITSQCAQLCGCPAGSIPPGGPPPPPGG